MRLHLLRLGTVRGLQGPIPAYLIRLDDATNILVDTGAPREPSPEIPSAARFDVDPSEHIVARLGELGLTPGDIDVVICTHLHPDHAGNNDAFPGAEFVVQRAELDAARAGVHPPVAWARPHWDGLTYRSVDGDTVMEQVAFTVFSHDAQQWSALRTGTHFYD